MFRLTSILRASAMLALLSVGGMVPVALGQTKSAGSAGTEDSAAFVREFPLVLVYQGLAQFAAGDHEGAIEVWQAYLERAGTAADTASANRLIHEAMVQEYPMLLVYEGLALAHGGDTTAAIESWERYLALAPEDGETAWVRDMMEHVFFQQYPMALLYRGILLFEEHRYQQAIESWERYLAHAGSEQERAGVRKLIAAARSELDVTEIVLYH